MDFSAVQALISVADDARAHKVDLPVLWLAYSGGRMGNRLLLAAHVRAFALETGRFMVDTNINEYSKFFGGGPVRKPEDPRHALDYLELCHALFYGAYPEHAPQGAAKHIDPRFRIFQAWPDHVWLEDQDFGGCDVACFRGFYVRSRHIAKHAAALREFYRPFADIEARAKARRGTGAMVGVHVRRTDFATASPNTYFDHATYALWARQACAIVGTNRVLVVSDEAPNPAAFEGLDVTWGDVKDPVGDLTALSMCNAILGPPSTFSLWASFYGNAPVAFVTDRRQVLTPGDFAVNYTLTLPGYF